MSRERKTSGNPTLADVAKAADVSAITVSRALRDPGSVSSQLRERIESAVRSIGYVPNSAARQLASARTDVIAVVIPSLTNAVFADVLTGIYDAAEGTRFQIQLGITNYSRLKEQELLRLFVSQRPAAMLITGSDHGDEVRRLLRGNDCPIVQIMEVGANPIDMQVGFSHEDAAGAGTRHLLSKGYRRIGFLAGQMDPRTQRRLAGYSRVMHEAGRFDEALIVTSSKPSSVVLGTALCSELLSRQVDPDAVQANNDDVALGAMFECQRRRMHIPQDFGIVGFNDLEFMGVASPSVTSVVTHRYEMGRKAMEMLNDAIAGRRPAQPSIDLGFELVARQSTARI
ncbi:LacI family DNA-binding transcriptional regulator [Devosia sp.]|uniref:LacI family DNA-binding transcriptional regulator n=1 Tax=Devosia sp. TaxID=1871048 RepID=UPI003263669B